MFEPSSVMTSIAEGGEFRFARFYIVCEAVPLGTLGNPLIVCGLSDTFRGLSKRGRDTESDAKSGRKKCKHFFGLPLVLLHLKVINTADQLICDLAELLCTDIHLLESIHYLFRLIVCLLRAVHIALHDF